MLAGRWRPALVATLTLLVLSTIPFHTSRAQTPTSDESAAEAKARMARRGLALTAGTWSVIGLPETSGVQYSNSMVFEGYFRKGLDKHLAIDNGVEFWMRTREVPASGGSGGEKATTYIIPQFTALTLFPFTTPQSHVEPFIQAGAGAAIGIDDPGSSTSGGLLGGTTSGSMQMAPGVGLKGGAGVQARLGAAFGVQVVARYQWVRFFQDLPDTRTYEGWAFAGGFTYRFQY